jgi:uncharacterized membrane protein YhaH (DUF805 family)
MFAGRYLWWMLIAMAIFLFFAICFDYVTWATVAMSGCARIAGSCGPIILTMTGSVKPVGVYLAGGIILAVTIARTRYIGLSWAWALAVFIWFVASAPFPLLLASGWTGQLKPETVFESLPVAFLLLVAFCAYIGWSFEDGGGKPLGPWRPLRVVVRVCAVYGALIAVAETPAFVALPARLLGQPSLSAWLAASQPRLRDLLTLGIDSNGLAYLACGVFASALVVSLLPPTIDHRCARFLAPFMLRGSRH